MVEFESDQRTAEDALGWVNHVTKKWSEQLGAEEREPLLPEQVAMARKAESPTGCDLLTEAEHWPTPNSRDHKGSDLESRNGGASLSHYVETGERTHPSLHLAPATLDGQTSSETPPGSRRRLNPAFTAWLMGFPWWWTHPGPPSSRLPEPIYTSPTALG